MDGRLVGDVTCATLIIGESGTIIGEISAESVRVYGTVEGQITAKSVELAKTARVIGDIAHQSLAVEAGAHVQGSFKRITQDVAEGVSTLPDGTTAKPLLTDQTARDGMEKLAAAS